MNRTITFLIGVMLVSCSIPSDTEINRELGRHQLPYRANERFVLTEIIGGSSVFDPPESIVYYLDGGRRVFRPHERGATDGYATYLGRIVASEIENKESPIMDEHVIRLITAEEITVIGNTINQGGIRLRSKSVSYTHLTLPTKA